MSTAVILEQIRALPSEEQDTLLRALILEQKQRRLAQPANRLANRLRELHAIYGPEPRPDSAAVWDELRADRP